MLKLAEMTLQREQLKLVDVSEWRGVCEARCVLVDVRRKVAASAGGAAWLASINDEELFAEKDRVAVPGGVAGMKKKMMSEAERAATGVSGVPGGGQTIKLKRLREDVAPSAAGMRGMETGAMLPTELHQLTIRRLADMQHAVDREVAKRKDGNWEDVTEVKRRSCICVIMHKTVIKLTEYRCSLARLSRMHTSTLPYRSPSDTSGRSPGTRAPTHHPHRLQTLPLPLHHLPDVHHRNPRISVQVLHSVYEQGVVVEPCSIVDHHHAHLPAPLWTSRSHDPFHLRCPCRSRLTKRRSAALNTGRGPLYCRVTMA